jgi:hypothetical protein
MVLSNKAVIGRPSLWISLFSWHWDSWGEIGNQEGERTPKVENTRMGGGSQSLDRNKNTNKMTISISYLHNSCRIDSGEYH